MTWFLKAIVFCTIAILVGFTLDVFGHTVFTCKRRCKDEPDNYTCGRSYHRDNGEPNGKLLPYYQFLRNECERKCFYYGEFERVEMDHCTKDGQNSTTYRCHAHRMRGSRFQKCMRNESMN